MGRKLTIVVEVQTDPPKPTKRRDWPAYLTVADRRHACDAVLAVIALKPDDIRDTVLSCTDTSQLEAWCDRAATAPSIDEIFKR